MQRQINKNWKTSHFDRMVAELSKYMTGDEITNCVNHMDVLETTHYDNNPTIDDCAVQIALLIGRDRYQQVKEQWANENQKVLSVFGTKKYKHKYSNEVYDGLDDDDKLSDYETIYT